MLAYDWNFLGLSLEAKPMTDEKVVDGSTFYECDTCDFYIFYQNKWYKQTLVSEDGINVCLYKSLMKKMFGKLFDSNITKGKLIKPDTGTNIEFTTNLPAQIIDLTGYGDSEQQTYTGKNLFDVNSVSRVNNGSITDGILTSTKETGKINISAYFGQSLEISSDKTMYLTCDLKIVSGTLSGIRMNDGSMNYVEIENPTPTSQFQHYVWRGTYSSNATVTRVFFQIVSGVDTVVQIKNIMFSETGGDYEPYTGSTPSQILSSPNPDYPQGINVVTGEQTVTVSDGTNSQSYTVDLGSIELCKIGDYQDYIYKSGDDWYVHKDIDKYTFDGTESWEAAAYGTNSWILRYKIFFPYDTSKIQIISNIFRGTSNGGRTGDNIIYSTSSNTFWIRNTSLSTLTQVQSATNGNYVHYALATPTDTQITDATLVAQLNALLNYTFPVGANNITITADELPMPLKLIISEKE